MSLICFPFKKEHVPTVLRNVKVAAEHPSTAVVLLVGACENTCYKQIVSAIDDANHSGTPYPVPVVTIVQNRVGTLRPGKGDGMNTALQYFMSAHKDPELGLSAPLNMIHFYDSDIESFDSMWISKAEEGMSLGYDIVRHFFARSSTDAQVTWQVTKVGFALLWPRSILPWVQQPLGGELCFSRAVVEALVQDPRVLRQSDWGIDTLYTFVTAQKGFSLFEAYVPLGKVHALYNGLGDLRNMICECFSAVQSLKDEQIKEAPTVHRIDPAGPVPTSLTQKIGYDVEKSLRLLRENWTDRQVEFLDLFSEDVRSGLLAARKWPQYMFMTEEAWIRAYAVFLEHFDLADDDWREVLFKVWVARVLNYTMRHVLRGYNVALQANTDMVMRLHTQRSIALVDSGSGASIGMNIAKKERRTASSPLTPEPWPLSATQPISPVPSEDDMCRGI